MSVLQKAGIAASKTLAKKVETLSGFDYELATFLFMNNASMITGDSAMDILTGAVDGYNIRFNKKIGISVKEEGIDITNISKEDWKSFINFTIEIFYECIGPTTFECCKGIKSIEDMVKKVKEKYGESSVQ